MPKFYIYYPSANTGGSLDGGFIIEGNPPVLTGPVTNGVEYVCREASEDFTLETPQAVTFVTGVTVGEPDAQRDVPIGIMGLTEPATTNWVVIAQGVAAPSYAQIEAGQDSTGAAAIDSGSFAVAPGGEFIADLVALANGDYQFVTFLENGAGARSEIFSGLNFTLDDPVAPPVVNQFDTPGNWGLDTNVTMNGGELVFPAGLANFSDAIQDPDTTSPVTEGTARVTINPSVVVAAGRFEIYLRTFVGSTGDSSSGTKRYDTDDDGPIQQGVPLVFDEPIPAGRDGLQVWIRMVSGGEVTFDLCTVEMI